MTRAIDRAARAAGIRLDPAQQALADRLAALGAALTDGGPRPRGLYLYGPVGRGKSWLMETFFAALPVTGKMRVHAHGFFVDLHRTLFGQRHDPEAFEHAVDEMIGDTEVLFFDELHVHDSGNARLLTRLLDHLADREVVVLATSNYAPDDLLPDPVWHHLFEPGVSRIVARMDVVELDGPIDYRIGRTDHTAGFAAGAWTTSHPAGHPAPADETHLTVQGRRFPVLAARPGELWASFTQLCQNPLSTIEYLEWADAYPRWVVTEVPSFRDVDPQAQQRFITLVDVLVDADVHATFVSEHERTAFLSEAAGRPDAVRMCSRLHLLQA